jgi:hypothetical protein
MSEKQRRMLELFEKHVGAELAGDLDTTMATMCDTPHLNHVPTMAGGVGRDGVRAFYRDHLVGKFFPPDVKMTNVSRTVEKIGSSKRYSSASPIRRPLTGCCQASHRPAKLSRWLLP